MTAADNLALLLLLLPVAGAAVALMHAAIVFRGSTQ